MSVIDIPSIAPSKQIHFFIDDSTITNAQGGGEDLNLENDNE